MTTIQLSAAADAAQGPLLQLTGDGAALAGVTIERTSGSQMVLLGIGPGDGLTVEDTALNCARTRWGSSCHGMQVTAPTSSVTRNVAIRRTSITDADYGLFQASTSTGTVADVHFDACTFARNRATDLELNAPKSHMRDIQVTNSTFEDNLATGPLAGWGVGLANVDGSLIEANTFSRYVMSAIHIEDRSSNVTVRKNSFLDVGRNDLNYQSDVMVMSGSSLVSVTDNVFRHSSPPGPTSVAIWVGHGGGAWPRDIVARGNRDIGGGGREMVGDYGVERLTTDDNRPQ